MLLSDVVDTAEVVAATRSRRAKIDAVAALLRRAADGGDPADLAATVGFLLARPRQGRLGVGWRTLAGVRGEHASAASVELSEVDNAFETLATTSGAGSVAAREGIVRALAERCTPGEWDFLSRVVRGELRTGALEGVLVESIARAGDRPLEAVRRAAMLSGDLAATAHLALTAPEGELEAVGLTVGRPLLPMLASTASSVAEAQERAGTASVEYKLDGARIQVHKLGDAVSIYTRSLADVTARLPDVVEVVRGLPVRDAIFDGETLALDDDGAPRPFQETMSRFGRTEDVGDEGAARVLLRPWFFDLMHLDGRDLIDEPLSVRLAELDRVAASWRIPSVVTSDPLEAEELSRAALAAGHEGVMVKALDSTYAAGRRGTSWIKVKPVLTFDLVVLAVEEGSGRRTGWLSNLHLGARDPDGDFGDPGGVVMVGKTFKGLTDEILRWQTEHFRAEAISTDGGVTRVPPATVVEIAIDGVQRSTRYPGGVALRFARVKGYRPDKRADEADTIAALRALLPAG